MRRRVAKNTVFLSLSQLLARGIGFLYFIFLARALGVATFGIYTFTLSFIYNFVPVADFGLERLVLRDISKKPEDAQFYFRKLFPLRLIFSFGSLVLAIVLGLFLGQSTRQIWYFSLFGIYLIPNCITYFIVSFQNAKEKMEWNALANIVSIALGVSMGIFFVLFHFPLTLIFLAYPFGNLAVAVYFFYKAKSWGYEFTFDCDTAFWKKSLGQSWIFAALLIMAVFYLRISVVMMGLLKGNYFTGLYGSIFKFIEAGILIPQSLALAFFPVSARLFADNKERLKKIYLKGLAILLVISLPFLIILLFAPSLIIELSYGEKYLEASKAFSILGVSLVLFFLNSFPGNIIQNSSKVKQFLPFAAANFLFALVLCYFLIPKFGLSGAALAVVGGEIFGFIVNNFFVYRLLNEKN